MGSQQSWIITLIQRSSLALIVIGVLLCVIGAAGGLSIDKFSLSPIDSFGRIALFVLGLFFSFSGIILLVREKRCVGEITQTSARSYGIKIDSHRDGTQVKAPDVEITGSYKIKPKDGIILQLFTIKRDDTGFWPHPDANVRFDDEKKKWYGTVSLGADGTGYSIFIAAALVTQSSQMLCKYYKQVGKMTHWAPVDGSLGDYAVECDRVLVERVV